MKAATSARQWAKPRLALRSRQGRLELFLRLPLTAAELQTLRRQVSRGVALAVVNDLLELAQPANRKKT